MLSKRRLLKSLVIAPLVMSVATPAQSSRRLLVQCTQINGMAYYDAEQVLARMSAGDSVRLIREPANQYDPKAVAVYWQQHKLGFIPRLSNYAVGKMLEQGQTLEARIVLLEPRLMPYQGFEIEIEWVG